MSFNQKKLLFSVSILAVSITVLGFGPGLAIGSGIVTGINS